MVDKINVGTKSNKNLSMNNKKMFQTYALQQMDYLKNKNTKDCSLLKTIPNLTQASP